MRISVAAAALAGKELVSTLNKSDPPVSMVLDCFYPAEGVEIAVFIEQGSHD
ncbi:MAG: hypothetical protein AB9873_16920 [Syntrophobacteraceae bacterium]